MIDHNYYPGDVLQWNTDKEANVAAADQVASKWAVFAVREGKIAGNPHEEYLDGWITRDFEGAKPMSALLKTALLYPEVWKMFVMSFNTAERLGVKS